MRPEIAVIFVVAITGMFAMAATTVRAIFKHRQTGSSPSDDRLEQISRQLAELQQSIDATAIEVERLGEGQRFTTKLLAERNRVPEPPRQPERVVTPH